MFLHEPPYDHWEEVRKPFLIECKIKEMCRSIAEQGQHSRFTEIFDYLYEHIEDNIEKFLGEEDEFINI